MSISSSAPAPLLGPGEIIKPSGKFSKPTRIPGKNYCKDEVVIRNADSGKGRKLILFYSLIVMIHCGVQNKFRYVLISIVVMGIKGRRVHMIEELSETIISFQRGKLLKRLTC